MDAKGHTKNFKITDLILHYYEDEFINDSRQFQGEVTPYNTQLVVYVDAAE
jgi:hypothetical protein